MKTKMIKNNIKILLLSTISIAMLSACDDSEDDATFTSQVTAPTAAVVNDSGSLILAESGLSLYTFDNDTLDTSNCNDACADTWPPLLAADGAEATDKMTILTRSDNSLQWAYKGQALYQFHEDSAQGDIAGDGLGNVWHLARPLPLKTAEINSINSYVGNQTISSVTDSSDVFSAFRSDEDGFTLYTFDNDPINDSACAGDCINAWPPLLADAGAVAVAPLSIVTLSNGNTQWTYKGKPLYFFVNDLVAGDINGDEVGDVFHIASQTPAIQRTTVNGRFLSATGLVNVLMSVDESTTDFTVTAMDKDGFNLYTFDNDTTEVSNCEEQCLVNWPAFVPNDEDVAIANYTIFERADGTMQWAYKGMPVYFFKNDTERGDINGSEIGGVFHLIAPTI